MDFWILPTLDRYIHQQTSKERETKKLASTTAKSACTWIYRYPGVAVEDGLNSIAEQQT